ncbi:uncharacterized protein AMSG_02161 [Thecamonas trahens ATCC 50062]|uniref:F-box domain-containing protein n=1 Tax=Thecamonas trahens ATCC 50062 TaxID=461836 RepID=A0A0L0DVA0_THETB|nr:hypothetical protein AMSG_02161 [Thecamonas trahens ATCC 50062]KNC56145.1 hypothetical protein AMSG_02161 [Thecamonas trahens ATCC 50062]|eukprot:XP_013761182.1 hypothetical protein AMSG_02161 [Thecamonas trahens ATCC 50062]
MGNARSSSARRGERDKVALDGVAIMETGEVEVMEDQVFAWELWNAFPAELQHLVLSFVDIRDLGALACTSKALAALLDDDYVWRVAYGSRFGFDDAACGGLGPGPSRATWRERLRARIGTRGLFPIARMLCVPPELGGVADADALAFASEYAVAWLSQAGQGVPTIRDVLMSLTYALSMRGLHVAWLAALAQRLLVDEPTLLPQTTVLRALHFVFYVTASPAVADHIEAHFAPLARELRNDRVATLGKTDDEMRACMAQGDAMFRSLEFAETFAYILRRALGVLQDSCNQFPPEVKAALAAIYNAHAAASDATDPDPDAADPDVADPDTAETTVLAAVAEYFIVITMVPVMASMFVTAFSDWKLCETVLFQGVTGVVFGVLRGQGLTSVPADHPLHDQLPLIQATLSQVIYTLITQGTSHARAGYCLAPAPPLASGALIQALVRLHTHGRDLAHCEPVARVVGSVDEEAMLLGWDAPGAGLSLPSDLSIRRIASPTSERMSHP